MASKLLGVGNALQSSHKKVFGKFQDGSTAKNRLSELLDKTEHYTRFILRQNYIHRNQKEKLAQNLITSKNSGNDQENLKNLSNGVSKRKLNKMANTGGKGEESSGDDEDNQLVLTRLHEQPTYLQGDKKLRDYQLDGLNWMVSLYETGINGILADEMGLGKTIQTISLLAFLREYKKINGHHLIIMPKSVVGNWIQEFKRWCPDIKICNLIARKECRDDIIKNQLLPGNFDVCITTFEGVRLCLNALKRFSFQYIIIDEAHKIKNEDSQTSRRIREIKSCYRLLLTGTPLQNNLHELWSLLNFLLPEIFQSSSDFDEWFDLKNDGSLTDAQLEEKNSMVIKQLHRILRPFMMRRIKREVEKALLPKIEMHINVGITETQKQIYRQLLKKSTIDKGSSTSHYKNILVQLRKVCNHPYLFPGVEAEDAPELGEHLIKTSGKMQFLDKLLKKCKNEKSQTLIFSGFTTMLNILEDYCRFREYDYCRLDGNTDLEDRQRQIDEYTMPNSSKFVFLISTRAGGLGLNLMTANTVVLYDSDWNPQMDLQAMDRAHRIGQQKQVRVYRLITKNTMEVKQIEKQTLKLKLDTMIIQKGRAQNNKTAFGKDDLKDMVNYGADAIFDIGSEIDDGDIENIIKEGEDKARNLNLQADKMLQDKFNMLNFEMNSCNLYEFEDVDYLQVKRKEQENLIQKNVIAMLDAETAENTRRKVKKNLAESNFCPKIYGNGNIGVSNEAKKKRLSKVTDFRFYPNPERLKELIELEMESKYSGFIQGREDQLFTPEMKIEKEIIESKGFPDWERRDFQKFVQALELYASDDYKNISKHMESTKTPEEVQRYAVVFFDRIHTLNDSAKIIQKIEKAQKNVSFNLRAPSVISQKLAQYEYPVDQINLVHATQKSKFFSKESDAILLYLTDKLGYGKWAEIKKAIKREVRCRFDHLFMSRGEDDLKKRVIYLVQCIEKELEEGPTMLHQAKDRLIENDQIDDESIKLERSADIENDQTVIMEAAKNSQSQESGIRIGDHCGNSEKSSRKKKSFAFKKRKSDRYDSQSKLEMNESEELDEIMNQEIIKEEINQDSAVKMDSNGGNMTTDLETNNERPSVISSKPTDQKKTTRGKENNQKNGKAQQNLANWVLSGSSHLKNEHSKGIESMNLVKTKDKALLGQKRTKCETRFDQSEER